MKRSTRLMKAITGVGLAAAMLPAAAGATVDGTGTTSLSATLNEGALTVFTPAETLSFGTSVLAGTSQSFSRNLGAWSVADATGHAKGWALSVQASPLTDGSQRLDGAVIQLKKLGDATSEGQANAAGPAETTPATGSSFALATDGVSATEVATAAPGKGMGAWEFPAALNGIALEIPATAKVGSYSGTLTFTLHENAI